MKVSTVLKQLLAVFYLGSCIAFFSQTAHAEGGVCTIIQLTDGTDKTLKCQLHCLPKKLQDNPEMVKWAESCNTNPKKCILGDLTGWEAWDLAKMLVGISQYKDGTMTITEFANNRYYYGTRLPNIEGDTKISS